MLFDSLVPLISWSTMLVAKKSWVPHFRSTGQPMRASLSSTYGQPTAPVAPLCHTCKKQRWGRIINILSMAAHQYPKGMSPYSAAKNALRSFTQSLAVELGPDNITVNAVSPGWIPVERHGPASLPGRMATAARTPLGHLGTAADVAGAVLYFASDLANFITGVEIPVCGGVHLL